MLEQSKPAFFALVILFLISGYTIAESSGISSDIDAIQLEIKHSQKGFIEVRKTEGKNTQKFDLAVRNLRSRINALNSSLKHSKQLDDSSSKVAKQKLSRLNADFSSLNKARSQSDWRVVERDLARLSSSAKELHSVVLNIPNAPGTSSRKPPEPPTASSGSNTGGIVKPGVNPKTIGIQKHPLPVTDKPVSKGPDDPRYAIAPHPVPHPRPGEPPPPPPDDDAGTNRPTNLEENVRAGSPSMMRKPSRPKGRLQDSIPKPKPIKIRGGANLYFGSGKSNAQKYKLEDLSKNLSKSPPIDAAIELSRTQISEAISRVRQKYNITTRGGGDPAFVMSPTEMKTRLLEGYFYELYNGTHLPWKRIYNDFFGEEHMVYAIGKRDIDFLNCRRISESDNPDDSPAHDSYIKFNLTKLDLGYSVYNESASIIYLADIQVSNGNWMVNGEMLESEGGHILYAFTASDLPIYNSEVPLEQHLYLHCLGAAEETIGYFRNIEIYRVN